MQFYNEAAEQTELDDAYERIEAIREHAKMAHEAIFQAKKYLTGSYGNNAKSQATGIVKLEEAMQIINSIMIE